MISRRFFFSFPIFIIFYIVQEAFVVQLRLPFAGFSLLLILTLIWAAMSTPEIGALTGLSYGDDHLRANPLNIVFLVIIGVVASQISYVILGFLLGENFGGFSRIIFICLGTAFWSAIVTPLILPIVSRLHAAVFGTASRI